MKYEDTKLDNNPEHKQIWEEFKERNLLRKMDVAFNLVPCRIDELKNKTSTDIRMIAENDADDETKEFVIDVPPLKQEFPELACQKSQVYPLPLSFENQCTTMGTANNLSLFSEEFNFPCKPAEKYIPMRQNAANFNLEAAYERYAFLKSLDKHKDKQRRYENILRKRDGESADKDNVQVLDNSIIGVLDSDSDSDNFSD
ncbi:uncharacterized protein LOC114540105 [Dendronephthya gigantea]|uniref:uncharacterized protein LOC114540105 n=1 Tax=Dendronephthya gigantea TaxID=151771 RepID=UPI00106DBE3C|nr:uncharacterized protein LOC114540105 [Dendronephthya gigantea]